MHKCKQTNHPLVHKGQLLGSELKHFIYTMEARND